MKISKRRYSFGGENVLFFSKNEPLSKVVEYQICEKKKELLVCFSIFGLSEIEHAVDSILENQEFTAFYSNNLDSFFVKVAHPNSPKILLRHRLSDKLFTIDYVFKFDSIELSNY